MFTKTELEINKELIKRKKREVLNSEGGSDLDYIRNLQTLIKLENAVDEELGALEE